ncbi:hatching enzyme-like [Oculina patagonica]
MKMLCSVLLAVLASQAFVFAFDDNETMAWKFLTKYRYISPTRSGNNNMETAIKKFQDFTGLPVTGKLDQATIAQMKAPRCGNPDNAVSSRVKRFNTATPWNKNRLTYFVSFGADLPRAVQARVFARALKYWADVSGLSFSRVRSKRTADLKIRFGTRRHKCEDSFDGPSGVLAHAFFPDDGRIHFDEAETFTVRTSNGINLLWVAVHEFGHALGLDHSDVRNAVMYPYYEGYVPNFDLRQDDIDAIQSLYGSS